MYFIFPVVVLAWVELQFLTAIEIYGDESQATSLCALDPKPAAYVLVPGALIACNTSGPRECNCIQWDFSSQGNPNCMEWSCFKENRQD